MPNPFCSNKNCHLPTPEILNELHKKLKLTWKQLADVYKVSERTIYRHAKPSEKERQKVKQKRGRKRKIFGEIRRLLLSFTAYKSEYNAKTQKEMASYICQEKGISVSQQTISRELIRENQTRKKIATQYCEQKLTKINEFVNSVCSLPLIYSAIDECSFHLNEAPRYAYAPRGKKAISPRPGNKGKNYTLILFVYWKEEGWAVHHQLIEGAIDTKIFHDFFANINFSTYTKLLLDNLRVHHANQSCKKLGLSPIKELLRSKNIEPTYLPPYTPQLNPVELIFNVVRHNIEKSRSWTFEKLKSSIDKEMKELNKQNLSKYFRKCFLDNLPELIFYDNVWKGEGVPPEGYPYIKNKIYKQDYWNCQ